MMTLPSLSDRKLPNLIEIPNLSDIPDLIEEMFHSDEETDEAILATRKIYYLCDVDHKHNRVAMVANVLCDVVTPLAMCLRDRKGIQRHIACLALNNLSIPYENKRLILFGSASRDVLSGLCHVISEQNSDSFMALICLMNLSFYQLGVTKILHFSPSDDGGFVSPLTNPKSLIRIIETILTSYPTIIKAESKKRNYWHTIQKKIRNNSSNSNMQENHFHRSEFLRWTYSLLKNLTICEQNCNLLGMTEIPKCTTDIIHTSNQPSSCWNRGSIEDFALFCIVNMAQCSVSRQSLMNNDSQAVYMMKPIMTASENIQGTKATLACIFLADDWTVLPQGDNGCQPTISQIITEMMVKVFERKEEMMMLDNKKQQQQNNQQQYCTFTTTTVMKAYRDLAILASRYENNHDTEKCIEILAKPSYISICLQTIAEVVFSTLDGNDDSSNINAAYAIGAIEALLPSIMQISNCIEDETKTSDKAAMRISELLSTYADLTVTSIDGAMESAYNSAIQLKNGKDSYRPILEECHELWKTGEI